MMQLGAYTNVGKQACWGWACWSKRTCKLTQTILPKARISFRVEKLYYVEMTAFVGINAQARSGVG